MTEIEKARSEQADAVAARQSIEREIQTKIEEVKNSFSSRLSEARRAVSEADKKVLDAQNAAVTPHEWDGKKVTRREYEMRKYGGGRTGKCIDMFGVVFTFRNGDQIGRGQYASAGMPVVRLLKKDGTLGLKTERLYAYDFRSEEECRWHLVKDEAQ